MNRCPEITEATKQAFIDAFLLINKKKSIEKISVRELSDAAGYNRSTFYNYFTDTYALYEYIEDYVIVHIKGRIIDTIFHAETDSDYIYSLCSIFEEWKEYLVFLLGNPYNQHFTIHLKAQLLQHGMEELKVSKDAISTSYRLDAYLSAVFSIIGRWLGNQEEMTLDELAVILRDIAQDGIFSRIKKY